jgi:hypothetical protein
MDFNGGNKILSNDQNPHKVCFFNEKKCKFWRKLLRLKPYSQTSADPTDKAYLKEATLNRVYSLIKFLQSFQGQSEESLAYQVLQLCVQQLQNFFVGP